MKNVRVVIEAECLMFVSANYAEYLVSIIGQRKFRGQNCSHSVGTTGEVQMILNRTVRAANAAYGDSRHRTVQFSSRSHLLHSRLKSPV